MLHAIPRQALQLFLQKPIESEAVTLILHDKDMLDDCGTTSANTVDFSAYVWGQREQIAVVTIGVSISELVRSHILPGRHVFVARLAHRRLVRRRRSSSEIDKSTAARPSRPGTVATV